MYMDWYEDIMEFHLKAKQVPVPFVPHIPDFTTRALRLDLIEEEVSELTEALKDGNLIKIADGIVDSIVVEIGTAISYGIDIRPIWNEIHKTNMAKFHRNGLIFSESGKVLKPEGWKSPRIEEILIKQIAKRGK